MKKCFFSKLKLYILQSRAKKLYCIFEYCCYVKKALLAAIIKKEANIMSGLEKKNRF